MSHLGWAILGQITALATLVRTRKRRSGKPAPPWLVQRLEGLAGLCAVLVVALGAVAEDHLGGGLGGGGVLAGRQRRGGLDGLVGLGLKALGVRPHGRQGLAGRIAFDARTLGHVGGENLGLVGDGLAGGGHVGRRGRRVAQRDAGLGDFLHRGLAGGERGGRIG